MNDQGRRLWYGIPNNEILPEVSEAFSPTLRDIELGSERQITKFKTLDTFLRIWTSPTRRLWDKIPAAWSFSLQLRSLDLMLPIVSNIQVPDSGPADQSVFLVSKPHWMWPTSTGHWSLYCQGRFYHLKAPGLVKNSVEATTSSGVDSMRVPVELEIQDFSHPDTQYARHFTGHRRALVAYQVGKTSYPPNIIKAIADIIIARLETYDFFEVNCHHFVLSLMHRTVMTTRDYSVFVGTAPQLAHWDLTGRNNANQPFFDKQRGFLIRQPRPATSKSILHMVPFVYFRTTVTTAAAIRILFQDGERRPGAFDPEGKRNAWRYITHVLAQDLSQSATATKRAIGEFSKDIGHRRWRDAFIGRLDTRLENYASVRDKAEKGSPIYKWTLPFHRWVLSIPPEHR